jgi:hypothetical protein
MVTTTARQDVKVPIVTVSMERKVMVIKAREYMW